MGSHGSPRESANPNPPCVYMFFPLWVLFAVFLDLVVFCFLKKESFLGRQGLISIGFAMVSACTPDFTHRSPHDFSVINFVSKSRNITFKYNFKHNRVRIGTKTHGTRRSA